MKLLLAPNDVNPGKPDYHSQTPLLIALSTGRWRSWDSSNLCQFRPPRGSISPHSTFVHLCVSLSQLFPFAYPRISAALVLSPNSFTIVYYIRCHHLDSLLPFSFPFYFPKLQSFNIRLEVEVTVLKAAKVAEGRKFLSVKLVIHYPKTLDRRALPIVLLLQLCGLPMSGPCFSSYSS